LISQIERGISMPSVTTLYAIVSALDLSLDELFVPAEPSAVAGSRPQPPHAPVVRGSERETLQLASGVRWERLTTEADRHTEFNFLVYEPGAASSEAGALVRHHGSEYGMVISGRLSVQLGFETYELGPGDSISFESWEPHRLATVGDEPVHAIWVVIDREGAVRAVAAPVVTAQAGMARTLQGS
jgi:mannose-6-phosphate isomerase-like protein (cupin superfamily)